MKGVIFGGAGFIGSATVSSLPDIDWTVVDDLSLGSFKNIEKSETTNIKGDISDRRLVDKLLKKKPGFVIMVNGLSSNPMYYPDPHRGFETVLTGALNVFDACRRFGIDKVVYASTSSIYGGTHHKEQHETANVKPPNFYACAKRAVEDVARIYADKYGINSVGFRYFSVYGYPERHKGEYANVISQFIWAMMEGKQPIVYGDGAQTRDATFISDVVEANKMAIEKDVKGAKVINVGTGKQTSFNRYVKLINEDLGTDIEAKYVKNPVHNYVYATKADVKRAKRLLGFKAKVGIKEGIRKTVDYYKKN